MSLVPFEAFVDPSGRPGPLRRFSGGPACGLLAVRREPTGIHWSSPPPLLSVLAVVLVLMLALVPVLMANNYILNS
jgi:hypothetical protein